MTQIPCAILNRQATHRVLQGHLWIYRTEIENIEGDPPDGNIVDVLNYRRRFVARGYLNRRSQIAIRVLARRPVEIDAAFFHERLAQAIAYRQERCPRRVSRRLIHSEADLLPGLILDQYGDILVLQTTTLGMDRCKESWSQILRESLAPRAILELNDAPARKAEGLVEAKKVLCGEFDGLLQARLGRADFVCDPFHAQKTGFYLDQQDNYELVSAFIRPGMRVLDAFCHLGGFAIHALLAGARAAVAVDSNAASIESARRAAALAGVESRLNTQCQNAFDFLRRSQADKERYDFIVLDPPSFTRTRGAVADAARGYKEIHLRAFKLLPAGGRLATFCCSHHIPAEMFQEIIKAAADDTGVLLRRELVMGASADHPVLASVPETEYLKGFLFTVLENRGLAERRALGPADRDGPATAPAATRYTPHPSNRHLSYSD